MNHPEVVLIVARSVSGVIGHNGTLPWHIPADLRRFKQLTTGSPMIMGRKTFDSLPGLLPGRRHIVLTRDQDWSDDGAEVAHNCEDALKLATAPRVSIIGGAQIYALFLARADRVEVTEVFSDTEGDTFLPAFDMTVWREIARVKHEAADDRPAFDFVTLTRAI